MAEQQTTRQWCAQKNWLIAWASSLVVFSPPAGASFAKRQRARVRKQKTSGQKRRPSGAEKGERGQQATSPRCVWPLFAAQPPANDYGALIRAPYFFSSQLHQVVSAQRMPIMLRASERYSMR